MRSLRKVSISNVGLSELLKIVSYTRFCVDKKIPGKCENNLQWSNVTKMGYQSMAKCYKNGKSVNGQMLLKWEISQWSNCTKIGNQSMAKFY